MTGMIGKIRTKIDSVTVEYDGQQYDYLLEKNEMVRKTKTFTGGKQSKAFYAKMMREGRNPRIIRAELN